MSKETPLILNVDDDNAARYVKSRILRLAGFNVVEAATGAAAMQLIDFDEDGNCIGSNFTDYLIPTAWETPEFEIGELSTPSPHHPLGAKGVGESPTVGSPAAYVNAVIDALWHAGVKNIDMPLTPDKVWMAMNEAGIAE